MKRITWPAPLTVGKLENTAQDVIQEVALNGEPARHEDRALHVDAILDDFVKNEKTSTLSNKQHEVLLELLKVPGMQIQPRVVNRFFFKCYKAVLQAEEYSGE